MRSANPNFSDTTTQFVMLQTQVHRHRFAYNPTRRWHLRVFPVLFGLAIFCATASIAMAANVVEKATDTPKPLNPQQSAALFKLPENLRIELVASAR